MQRGPSPGNGHGVKERVRTELRAYALTSGYLFVWLSALLLYKTGVLREGGVAALPFGIAAAKALILGKFVLLGESLGVGSRVGAPTLAHRIVFRSLSLLMVLVVLTLLEELVLGWVHGRPSAQTLAEFANRRSLELAASCLLMLLVLMPFVAAKQISLALGPDVLRGMLLKNTREKG